MAPTTMRKIPSPMYMLTPVLAGPVEPVSVTVVRKGPNGADERAVGAPTSEPPAPGRAGRTSVRRVVHRRGRDAPPSTGAEFRVVSCPAVCRSTRCAATVSVAIALGSVVGGRS